MRRSYLTLLLVVVSVASAYADDLIWIEGEDATAQTMRRHGWYDSVKKAELSGQEWLSHFGGDRAPIASFEFRSEQSGDHVLWLRANPVGSAMSIRLNGDSWKSVAFEGSEQRLNIASDAKPDLRFVAWVKFGKVPLRRGPNRLEVRFESKNNRHGGLDCFVLSREPFFPQGSLRPGQKTGLADSGMWAFEPGRDAFDEASLLDLSGLNEKPAGKHGWVKRSADGADFVDGAGKPIRFWAVNTTVQYRDDLAAVEEHARWLAKRGVNMVRHHGHLAPKGERIDQVNQSDVEAAWRLVAAMKKQGIYVTLSPYWAVSVKYKPAWGLKNPGGENLTGLLFFDRELQQAYKSWLRQLLSPPNPHTGIPLATDPTLAIFQIQNEDSLLFWTEQSIEGEQRQELARQFGDWLTNKYGSLAAASKAWGGQTRVAGDDFGAGVVMPQKIYHLTQQQRGAMAQRLNDQLAFYTHLMATFNADIAAFLKDELGYDGLVNAGNWRTADQGKLLDAERYSYAVNDVIGINRYYTGGHTNPTEKHKAGYLVSPGDTFTSRSALKNPGAFPLALRQVHGHPMIISESAWVPPLRHQSEGPFLVAAYGAMTGFDIFYWFSTGDIGYGPPMGKWQLSTPAQIGMFPAAALMFRRGDIQKAEPSLLESRTPDEVWSRRIPMVAEQAGFDPNRDGSPPTSDEDVMRAGKVTPLTFLSGPVEVAFEFGPTRLLNLRPLIDATKKTVKSSTRELSWDYGVGLCQLKTPKAQGATGHLGDAGTISLGTFSIDCENDYATILAVSLDDRELATSNRILVQVGTTARPCGWRTSNVGSDTKRIDKIGSSPWNIELTQATVRLKNNALTTAVILDANGMAREEQQLKRSGDTVTFVLPPDAMYVILRYRALGVCGASPRSSENMT